MTLHSQNDFSIPEETVFTRIKRLPIYFLTMDGLLKLPGGWP